MLSLPRAASLLPRAPVSPPVAPPRLVAYEHLNRADARALVRCRWLCKSHCTWAVRNGGAERSGRRFQARPGAAGRARARSGQGFLEPVIDVVALGEWVSLAVAADGIWLFDV